VKGCLKFLLLAAIILIVLFIISKGCEFEIELTPILKRETPTVDAPTY